MRSLWLLLRKDLFLELRSREVISGSVALLVLLIVFLALGLHTAIIADAVVRRITPVFFWLFIFLVILLCADRAHWYEKSAGAIIRLQVLQISPALQFISKSIVLLISSLLLVVIATGLTQVFLHTSVPHMLVTAATTLPALCLAASLLAPIASTLRLSSLGLPLIALPLLSPLLLGALELAYSPAPTSSPWFSLLIGLTILYFLLGINLYRFSVEDSR